MTTIRAIAAVLLSPLLALIGVAWLVLCVVWDREWLGIE